MTNENFSSNPTNQPNNPNVPPNTPPNSEPSVNSTQFVPENKFAAIEKLKNSINTGQPININPTPTSQPSSTTTTNFDINNTLTSLLSNKKLIIGIIIALLIIFGGGYAYYYFVYNQGTLELTLATTPDELKINDQIYTTTNPQTIKFQPGTYNLTATKDKFYPLHTNFQITAGQTTPLTINLNPYPTPNELIQYPTQFPHLDPTGQEISYLSNFGTTFYKINLNTFEKDTISSNIFNHITDIQWAPSSRQANIITSINDAKISQFQITNDLYDQSLPANAISYHLFDFSKYDLVSQKLISYPTTILNPTWHPSKEEIVFQYFDPTTGENTLSKSKPNLEDKQVLFDLPGFTNALAKYSPNAELIAIVDTDHTTTAEPNPVYLFHTVPRNFEKIPTKDIYTNIIWSPDSTKLIAIKNDNTPTIFDINTFAATDINLKADINHIAWFNDSSKLVIFPINPTTNGEILIYDLTTQQTTPVTMTTDQKFQTITNPIINRTNDTLYFTGNELLYSLAIE